MTNQRKKNRLAGFDYSASGAYFVTVCARNQRCYFGSVENGVLCLNAAGNIVQQQWEWLHQQYVYLSLDAFVVMPNHFHAILMVGTGHDQSLRNDDGLMQSKIKSVSELLGAFKTTSSKLIHQAGELDFHWQRSFYDHIIRTPRTHEKIRHYIQNNPAQWEQDVEYSVGTGRDLSLQKGSYYRRLFDTED